MSNEIIRGRHRAPGRHNPLNELKLLARESAQPAMKGAAVVAATGGLVASFAGSASAETVSANIANVGAPQAAAAAAPAVVGPATTAAPAASTALATIGFTTQPKAVAATAKAPAKPRVIEDIKVKGERQAAAAKAKAAAERKAAAVKAAAQRKADRRQGVARPDPPLAHLEHLGDEADDQHLHAERLLRQPRIAQLGHRLASARGARCPSGTSPRATTPAAGPATR